VIEKYKKSYTHVLGTASLERARVYISTEFNAVGVGVKSYGDANSLVVSFGEAQNYSSSGQKKKDVLERLANPQNYTEVDTERVKFYPEGQYPTQEECNGWVITMIIRHKQVNAAGNVILFERVKSQNS
jgi:hypothetical protein